MMYKVAVLLHLLGAAVWIGSHVALVAVVLPAALRRRDVARIVEFERGVGRVGLAALVLQIVTGLWLAKVWLGGWGNIFNRANPASHLVLMKLGLIVMTFVLAGHAYHWLLPRLDAGRLRGFVVHAWVTTALSVLMLVVGASIRLGGPL